MAEATENQNTEFKENWRDEYLKCICGFANAQGEWQQKLPGVCRHYPKDYPKDYKNSDGATTGHFGIYKTESVRNEEGNKR